MYSSLMTLFFIKNLELAKGAIRHYNKNKQREMGSIRNALNTALKLKTKAED